jgi:DNA repair protein RadC
MITIKKKKKGFRIKDMAYTLRPREKLLAVGAHNVTDAELVAILLGTGSSKHNALVLAKKLLKEFPLKDFDKHVKEVVRYPGVGVGKAARIIAALELGERLYAPASMTKIIIRTAKDAAAQVHDIVDKKQECLVVLYLNARFELILKEVVGVGSLNSLQITPKEILSPALMTPCAAFIVVHNHPSNDPSPSDEDIHFTKRIHEAGEVMGILLLDHVIVAKNSFYSFKEDKKKA